MMNLGAPVLFLFRQHGDQLRIGELAGKKKHACKRCCASGLRLFVC